MNDHDLDDFVRQAELIYQNKLQKLLEEDHLDEFVAIDPISGAFFLGKTLGEATQAARAANPDRLTHVMRVGHSAAVHFGMQVR